jgi:hypothetical protein
LYIIRDPKCIENPHSFSWAAVCCWPTVVFISRLVKLRDFLLVNDNEKHPEQFKLMILKVNVNPGFVKIKLRDFLLVNVNEKRPELVKLIEILKVNVKGAKRPELIKNKEL